MPTIAIIGPYRFYFWSGDRNEPAHVHVAREAARAKFWLNPVLFDRAAGFSGHELKQIERLVIENAQTWLEKWNEYFADGTL
jgi:hypothetical protein